MLHYKRGGGIQIQNNKEDGVPPHIHRWPLVNMWGHSENVTGICEYVEPSFCQRVNTIVMNPCVWGWGIQANIIMHNEGKGGGGVDPTLKI